MANRMRMLGDGRSFLADIDEKALREFEQCLPIAELPAARRLDLRTRAPGSSELLLDKPTFVKHSPPFHFASALAVGQDVPRPPVDNGGSDLLASLERGIAAKKQQAAGVGAPEAKAQQVSNALMRIFKFFNEIANLANRLEPEICRNYRLDAQTGYVRLRWQASVADYRKQGMAENALVAQVNFRVRLVAAQPITMVRRWDQVDALKRDLHVLNLRTLDEPLLAKKPAQEFVRVQLAPDIPIQIIFQGNYAKNCINVLCRNLEGFCISAFVLDIDKVTQKLLDDFGRFLLSWSSFMPEALRRVHSLPCTDKLQ